MIIHYKKRIKNFFYTNHIFSKRILYFSRHDHFFTSLKRLWNAGLFPYPVIAKSRKTLWQSLEIDLPSQDCRASLAVTNKGKMHRQTLSVVFDCVYRSAQKMMLLRPNGNTLEPHQSTCINPEVPSLLPDKFYPILPRFPLSNSDVSRHPRQRFLCILTYFFLSVFYHVNRTYQKMQSIFMFLHQNTRNGRCFWHIFECFWQNFQFFAP